MQSNKLAFGARNKVAAPEGWALGLALTLLASCGGGSGGSSAGTPSPSPTPTPATAPISVSVSGLRPGQQIILANNASDRLTITENRSYSFANAVAVGQNYAVTIATPPTGETCMLNGATGTVQSATAVSVTVSCGPTILHSFAGADGASDANVFTLSPNITLAADGNIYGTVVRGGSKDFGTVFKLTPAGTFTVLHNFDGSADGKYPEASLLEGPGGELYGTTTQGGVNGVGTLFKITRDGTFTLLNSFGGTGGVASPKAALLQEGGDLYGTSNGGGTYGRGTVFKFTMSSGTVSVLYSFNSADGDLPAAPLVRTSDGNFYGTTSSGGLNGGGRVFKITPAGALTVLHDFDGADGSYLYGPILRDANDNVFGTTYSASPGKTTNISGNIFKISASGAYSVVHQFVATDGALPVGGLIRGTDGNIYGTTSSGGGDSSAATMGTIFSITPAEVFTVLHTFADAGTGRVPRAPLIQDQSGVIYGTTSGGGTSDLGTIFKF